MKSPLESTPEESRFFAELARVEPSEEADLKVLKAAGFEAGRRAGLRQVRGLAVQFAMVAAMVVVSVTVIFLVPRENGTKPVERGPRPVAGVPATLPPGTVSGETVSPGAGSDQRAGEGAASGSPVPSSAASAGDLEVREVELELRMMQQELLGLRDLAGEIPPEHEEERREASLRIQAALETIQRLTERLNEGLTVPPDEVLESRAGRTESESVTERPDGG